MEFDYSFVPISLLTFLTSNIFSRIFMILLGCIFSLLEEVFLKYPHFLCNFVLSLMF
jgi:hypothetical protein